MTLTLASRLISCPQYSISPTTDVSSREAILVFHQQLPAPTAPLLPLMPDQQLLIPAALWLPDPWPPGTSTCPAAPPDTLTSSLRAHRCWCTLLWSHFPPEMVHLVICCHFQLNLKLLNHVLLILAHCLTHTFFEWVTKLMNPFPQKNTLCLLFSVRNHDKHTTVSAQLIMGLFVLNCEAEV